MPDTRKLLLRIHKALLEAFGPQHWWPGETAFEVMVGAILTQNTAWTNVERAVGNLRDANLLCPNALTKARNGRLARLIRPSGYFNQKADRLKSFAQWLVKRTNGDAARLFDTDAAALREELLALKGIGPETADSILLYAGNVPVFVVDAYTRRAFSRHFFIDSDAKYHEIRTFFERNLPAKWTLFNEFHALIVALGKDICRPTPRCSACPIRQILDHAGRPYRGPQAD